MACLYADEQFPREVSVRLRAMGHDVLTVQEAVDALPQLEAVGFSATGESCEANPL